MNTEREQRVRAAIADLLEAHTECAQRGFTATRVYARDHAEKRIVAIAMEPAADEAGLLRRLREVRDQAFADAMPASYLDQENRAVDLEWLLNTMDRLLAAGQAPKESNDGRV
jgi:hypothetical protein